MSAFILFSCLNLAILPQFPDANKHRFLKWKRNWHVSVFTLFLFKPCNTCTTPAEISLTLWHPIVLIGLLSRNRARGEERWRRRCRWGMMWRTCAVERSSLLLSLLSPPPLLQSCPTVQHRPYRGGWRNAACWIPAWYRPCRGLFRRWSIAQQWQSRIGAVTHGRSPERLSLACGSGLKTRSWRCLKNDMSRRVRWLPVCQWRACGCCWYVYVLSFLMRCL